MGLDMYLFGRKYLWMGWSEDSPEQKIQRGISQLLGGDPETFKVTDLKAEVIYWRKANHIHNWFVKHVQLGVDDCGEYEVSREQLSQLLVLCNEVIADRTLAQSRLPTTAGFFFGGTEYGEYYWTDTEFTRDNIEKILNNPLYDGWTFSYHSSW